jgi:glycosyltransferase involved in cell wall biosynthesis
MKCLNEEYAVKRVISDFYHEKFCERVIVIDGGSTDYTREELAQFDKVEVFVHPWLDWYHDMEVVQSNIALSYVPNGSLAIIMDFDERMNQEMKDVLNEVDSVGRIPNGALSGDFARRTVEILRHEDSPFAILGDDGWPIESHQIGQWPDYQCRLIHKDPRLHWANSPHHVLMGSPGGPYQFPDTAFIHHFEKDDARDRFRIEKKWLRHVERRRELGLPSDVFETRTKKEVVQFSGGAYWRKKK